MATARGSTIATATTSTSTRPAHAGAPEERADGERDRGGGQRDIDEQTTAGGRVRAWCLDSGEAIPAQNIGAGGNQLGPGKRPQQIHQRGQVAAGQPLAELDADVAAAAVPALAQGHSGYFQADIAGSMTAMPSDSSGSPTTLPPQGPGRVAGHGRSWSPGA